MIDKQRLEDAKAGNVKEQFSVGMYYYEGAFGLGKDIAVSYTHLTLPTTPYE